MGAFTTYVLRLVASIFSNTVARVRCAVEKNLTINTRHYGSIDLRLNLIQSFLPIWS